MKIQLIQGAFNSKDALDLITQLMNIKIKYHENKINSDSSEEDIKWRESKIKRLHNELFECREGIQSADKNVTIESIINIE
ncbi:MAG: hypothetical protein JST81_02010 [Bacteroidetes bacterium]|nr:hypothetical protein [Bacteroidota bacterium]